MVQPELRFRRTMASLAVFYLVCLALGAFAVVVLIETHGSAAPTMVPGAVLALVIGPLLGTYRERLREIGVGPDGVRLSGFGLDRRLSWADLGAAGFLHIGGPRSVVFVAFALRDGLTPPRVGGGPPAATAHGGDQPARRGGGQPGAPPDSGSPAGRLATLICGCRRR